MWFNTVIEKPEVVSSEHSFKRGHLANLIFPGAELLKWENLYGKQTSENVCNKNEIHNEYHHRNQNNNKYSVKRSLCPSDIKSLNAEWQIL